MRRRNNAKVELWFKVTKYYIKEAGTERQCCTESLILSPTRKEAEKAGRDEGLKYMTPHDIKRFWKERDGTGFGITERLVLIRAGCKTIGNPVDMSTVLRLGRPKKIPAV